MCDAEKCTRCGAELEEGVTNEALDKGADLSNEQKDEASSAAKDYAEAPVGEEGEEARKEASDRAEDEANEDNEDKEDE